MATIAQIIQTRALRIGIRGDGVKALQEVLQRHGHQLVVDGDFGANTQAAVRRFQAAHGLAPDGIVGPLTARALDGPAPPADTVEPRLESVREVAPWLTVMRAITGTAEIPGARSNPLILKWRDEIIASYPEIKPNLSWYVNDDTPWCGLAAGYGVAHAGYRPPLTLLRAKSWFDSWADGVRLKGPALGAILVKSRTGGGHVTYYEGENATHYFCRGGNQSNRVNVAKIAKNNDVLGFMWPKGHPLPEVGPVRVSFSDAVAGSEA